MKKGNEKTTIKTVLLATAMTVVFSLPYLLCLPRNLFDSPVCAVLESSDGTLMGARIAADGQWRFPAVKEVPEKFAKCIITYEDKRFKWHPGVDPLAIGRAIKLNAGAGEVRSGASTLTMQTIRLSRGAKRRTIKEKLIEAIQATRLELRCSKKEILALYASNAPFGGNVVGLEAASWRYFGRSAEELSWSESATLAVLPNAPALIHPGKNRDKLLEKRNFLLDKLFSNGTIDSTECMLAKDEDLPQKPFPMPDISHHYLETLRKEGGDRRYGSSIDIGLQRRAEELLSRHVKVFETNNVYNIAALVLDVRSGKPVVYCGNTWNPSTDAGEKSDGHGRSVDVVRAPRSSGSTLKPLLYAALLDEGEILPTTLISDIPFHFKDFTPNNFNHTFDGAVPAYSVIQRSLNVPSVRMLYDYGVQKFIFLLQKIGFSTITRGEDDYGLSLILGGAEVKLWDLAAAYRNMAFELTDFAVHPSRKSDFPLSAAAIWCTFDALQGVSRPEEEGDWASFNSSRNVAWKTGTSYGNRDAWSVGVTPEYVVAVWVGNCDGVGRPLLTGVGYAAPVMFDILSTLPPTSSFEIPEAQMEYVPVCHLSGHPLSEACLMSEEEPVADTILAPRAVQRPDACPYHKIVHLSEDGAYQVNSDCYSVSQMKNVSWFVLPPAQEWYYMRTHSDYRQLPPLHPLYYSGNAAEGAKAIEILYPQNGMSVAAPVSLDSKRQGVVFAAAHNDPDAVIYWHLDDNYLGSTSSGEHKILVVPESGPHTLTIVDAVGNSAVVRFTVK
jgi:penicillin-binding protein 1C